MSQNWTLARTSSPSGLAVSLGEVKAHLRISGISQDSELTLLVEASTEKLERDINRGILQATWKQAQQAFPDCQDAIKLYMGNTTTVSSITYVDSDKATQTLDPTLYSFSVARGVIFNEGDNWPETDITTASDKVFVNFTAGVSDADCIPRLYKQAILMETGRAYFDPAQEAQQNADNGKSYELLVRKLIRSSYP